MSFNNLCIKIFRISALTVLVLFAASHISYSQTTSWKGTTNTSWTTATNWTNGVPTATVDAIIGDANFSNTNHPAIPSSASGTIACKSLTIGGGTYPVSLTINKNIAVNGDLVINGNGTLNHLPSNTSTTAVITLKGNWSNSGTYAADSTTGNYASVVFGGTTTQTLTCSVATTFMKLATSTGSTVTLNNDVRVVALSSIAGIFNIGSKVITGDMPVTVTATGDLKITAASIVANFGASVFTFNTGGIIEFNGTSSQTIAALAYSNIVINGSGTKTLAGNLTNLKASATAGNITVNSGTLDLAGYTANRASTPAGGLLSVASGATLKVGGTTTLPGNFAGYSFDAASTVEYSGTDQTVSGQTYGHLILSSSSGAAVKTMPSTAFIVAGNFTSKVGAGTSVTYTAKSNITCSGSVDIGVNTSFTGGAYSHSVAGNWVNNGTFSGSGGTLTMSGTSATLSGSGSHTFGSLILSGSGISAPSSASLNISGDLLTTGAGTFMHATGGTLTMSGSSKSISSKGIVLDNLIISGSATLSSTIANTSAGAIEVNALTISPSTGSPLSIGNETLKIKGSITTSGGRITATGGKVDFNGTSAQVIPASIFGSNTIKDIQVSNAAGVTINGTTKLTGTLSFGNVNNSTVTTKGNLTLVSTLNTTANVADVTNAGVNTGNNISGIVTVERYFTAKRAYRFLTAPVTTAGSIKVNWMENTNNTSTSVNNNPTANYGTHITGAGGSTNGFDQTVLNSPSLFTFTNTSPAWVAVANTAGLIKPGIPYRILIRGSRSTDLNSNTATPSVTTLRSKGTLISGTVVLKKTGGGGTTGMPVLSSSVNGFSFVGNPYASSIDWESVEKVQVSSTMYIFDPTLSGSNGRGAYVSYNASTHANSNSTSAIDKNIQSGQAFFILSTGTDPSLTFKETHKTSMFQPVFRTLGGAASMDIQLLLPSQVVTGGAADGCKAFFSNNYDNSLGDEDSYKFTNQDENISILRNGKSLSIEGRKPVTANDTLPLKMWQLTQSGYTIKIASNNFPPNVDAYLEDAFLKTSLPLTANAETKVAFDITSNPASAASDRFQIVFKVSNKPFRFAGLKAVAIDKLIAIKWLTIEDFQAKKFEVERSGDNMEFAKIADLNADKELSAGYSITDANPLSGDNFYRLKSIDKMGGIKYSSSVKVVFNSGRNICVYNNTGNSKSINLGFSNMEKGTYNITLLNSFGQRMFSAAITHDGGTATHSVSTNLTLTAGVYKVQVTNNSSVNNLSLLVP